MCRQKSHPSKKRKRKQKITSNVVTVKPAQKTRTKRRKPKYLSLSLKLSPQKNYKKTKMTHNKKKQKLQLNLFPLHPEKKVEEDSSSSEDMHDQDDSNNNNNNNNNNSNSNSVIDASFLFDTATDSTTTLDGLLTASEEGPLSPPTTTMVTYGKSTDESGECSNYGLVRTAMRCKERDASEEKWVSYSEVVDSKQMEIKEEEGSSCVDDDDDDEGAWRVKQGQKKKRLLLDLKLDYQEIMNAWSDKGPLFVDGESPQTVPDILHDPNMLIDAWSYSGNLCSVPEMTGNVGSLKVDELGCKEGWNREHREASVLRYKEKRQNRLFAKRIRYEVRKLNAEKRPRMKGRFVKRNSEA